VTTNEFLAILVVIFCWGTAGIHGYMAIWGNSGRWLDALKALSFGWLGLVFAVSYGQQVPVMSGRPAVVAIAAVTLAGAIFNLRSRWGKPTR
jgi:hypothetical protein